MYVIGKTKLDSSNRVNISGLFKKNLSNVVLGIEDEKIVVFPAEEVKDFGSQMSVESKNRITIPKWIRQEMGKVKVFYLGYEPSNGRHYLVPKKTSDAAAK